MNITTGDIINYNSAIYFSQDFLAKNTNINLNYLRVAKSRAKSSSPNASWKFIEIQNRHYFAYIHIPGHYREQLPEFETIKNYAVKPDNDIQKLVDDALTNSYKLFMAAYASFERKKARALAQSAAIIHEARNYIEIKDLPYSKSAFFEKLAGEIRLQDIKYLPKSWRNLRDKIRLYAGETAIKEIVKSKNEDNKNKARFSNNDLIKGWLFELANTQRNYSSAFIYRKIRLLCEQSGIEDTPSLRWVSDYISKPETKYLIQQRYGTNSRFNHQQRGYTPTQTALYAGDCWQIDGTRVNIIDHRGTWTDKDGKRHSGQKFLYIVAVRDVMSGLPVGWEYCYEESAAAITGALTMAVRNTGYLPYELIYDRFPGHNTERWSWIEYNLRRRGVLMTITHKAEGKANIERWFGTLQSVFMAESDLYYGEGVKSTRRNAHRSKEYVSEMRRWALKNGFDFDDACRETDKFLSNYAQTPYNQYSGKFRHIDKSPEQLHGESDKPNTYPVSQPDFCYLFGLRKQVSIRNYMIQTQIENAAYYYGIEDCSLVEKYTGEKLLNCFDYEDLSSVHLFDGETYLGTFNQVEPAQRFGPEKDMRAVGKMKKIAADNEAQRKRKLQEIEARKKAIQNDDDETTPEVGILLIGRLKKQIYEMAETSYLREAWEAEEEYEELDINVRHQY